MTESEEKIALGDLRDALAHSNQGAVDQYLEYFDRAESALLISRLAEHEQAELLKLIGSQQAAEIVETLPEAEAARILEQLPPFEAAAIVSELPSDEQADVIGRMHDYDAAAILDEMEPTEAAETRHLLEYPSESAGGIMITEYLHYEQSQTVDDVLNDLRTHAEEYRRYEVQYAYVVHHTQLVGVLRLRDLLLASGDIRLEELMIDDPLRVSADESLEHLERFFDLHPLFGVPVVEGSRLVGVVLKQDVEEAAEERSSRNLLKFTGIMGGEELRTMPLRLRCLRRLSWLSINIVLNVVAASVIAYHQDTLSAVIALAVFLPIISDMSGCSGNQAVAVSMRELSIGMVKPTEFWRVFWKEAMVGIINGIVLGLLLGIIAGLWQSNSVLGVVVGAALAVNTIVAACLGGTVPLLLRGLGQDPALASGPILTTVTDMCGFFLVLTLASSTLDYLTAM